MPRKNRGYKKGEPYRDARLFVIACEGAKREKQYFEELVSGRQRLKLLVLAPAQEEPGFSAPKWVLDRAVQYTEEIGLASDDQMWLVMDTDRWQVNELRAIIDHCHSKKHWYIALSNPCFEIWLIQHLADLPETDKSCQDLKRELAQLSPGGYRAVVFLEKIADAIQRASARDNNPDYDLPTKMVTKVYKLAQAIATFL
jgi:hypothetical protein